MTHLDDGVLRTYLDGELRGAEADRVRAHLEDCAACAARLAALEQRRETAGRALGAVDVPVPLERARDEVRDRLARRRSGASSLSGRRALARAAVLLLLLAGIAADRLPGSPVRGWFGELLGEARALLVGSPEEGAPEGAGGPADAAGAAAESGVRVAPVGGIVRIVLTDVAPGSRIDVRLVDGGEAGVRGAGSEGFRTAPGLIEAVAPASPIRVEIPREVPSATVEVDGRVYLRKEGGRLEVVEPATDSTEAELRFRTPGGDGPPRLD